MRKTGYSSLLTLTVICLSSVLLVGCKDNKQLDKNSSLTKTPDSNKSITEAAKPSKGEIMSQQSDEAVKDSNPRIIMETSMGNIELELDAKAAPVTVKNFLRYVNEDFFNGTIFHRVISNFMIQGGGFTEDMNKKGTHASIINEAVNGLKNDRGTIAMARTNDPDSATAQFFINVKDNDSLNYNPGNPGYAVFGKVVEGMDVVDAIRAVKTTTRKGMGDVPVEPVVIKKVSIKE